MPAPHNAYALESTGVFGTGRTELATRIAVDGTSSPGFARRTDEGVCPHVISAAWYGVDGWRTAPEG
jgi:hypothetical protein